MAAVAISDATDGRRILALSGRLEATTIRGVWDESRRAIAAAPDQRVVVDAADVDYCDGAGIALLVDLMRSNARRATSQVANLQSGIRDAAAAVRPAGTRPRPRSAGRRADRPSRRSASSPPTCGDDLRAAGRLHRRDRRCAGVRAVAPVDDSLEGRLAHLRARRRRRAADRRADLVPARRDPRVPVGDPDEASSARRSSSPT